MSVGDSFNLLPNEVIRETFKHLSWEQRIALLRVSRLWNYLGSADYHIEKRALEEIHPSVAAEMTNEKWAALNESSVIALFEQQKLYEEMAEVYKLSPEYVQTSFLRAFFDPDKKDKSAQSFTLEQIEFLKAFAVATGVFDEIEGVDKGQAFIWMAKFGNLSKIKEWDETYGKEISNEDKESALCQAAREGHLECVEYLSEKCGKNAATSAFLHAAEKGHSDVRDYLVKKSTVNVVSEYGIRVAFFFDRIIQHYRPAEASSQSLENSSPADHFLIFAHARKRQREEESANNASNENEMPKEKKRKLTASASPTN